MASACMQTSDVDDVLENLGLKHYFPEKLSRNDLYQVTQESLHQNKSKCPAAWQFIYNITRYNYQARNIQSSRTELINTSQMGRRERKRMAKAVQRSFDHPLDVISSIFLCCDPVARQDLTMHLWGCKLAVPLSLQPNQSEPPLMYIWSLRSLIGQFQDRNSLVEMPLVNKKMKGIAMVRVGENIQYSKSYLLNCLIGGPEKAHPIFFHRNSEGSKRTRSNISNGLVEIGWYMSSDSKTKRFDGPRFFVNLRGNAEDLIAQRRLIGQLATVTLVLSTVANIENTKYTIKDLLSNGSNVILFISDYNPDDDIIDNFMEACFSDIPDSKFDVVTSAGCMMSELLEKLYYNIRRLEADNTRNMCLAEIKTLSESICLVDENNKSYLAATKITNSIVSSIQNETDLERKEKLLPLQDRFWKEWSEKDRDLFRYDELEPSEREQYGSRQQLARHLNEIRKNEYQQFLKYGLSEPVTYFIFALSQLDKNSRKIFLRLIKLELDNLSRKHLRPLYDEYLQLVNSMVDARDKQRIKFNERLNELDNQMTRLSLGLEHIIREIGQVYEACESQQEEHVGVIEINRKTIQYTELPKFACMVLAEGYSIEILDGDACSVPLRWIKAVLRELPSVLKIDDNTGSEVKVNIVSILGIQSSGKSTFLNTVFGLQFAVSAGRCTRGAFFQLVKVHSSLKEDTDVDYILAIDTEGLQSQSEELTSLDSRKKDNELSTFVIGLADTTVINLMGENATYLNENLPIVVHAFLRMNMAGLNPRCSIVHHNVDKRNKEKLLQQGRMLEQVLNKLTCKACELENIPPKLFKDIIDFSISRHTDYIPALFEGEQPMTPISVGYSAEADEIRAKLVQFIKHDSNAYTLSRFSNRLENLWCAIKTDRFVYEFRTTLEAEARLEVEKGYSDYLFGYLKDLDSIILSLMPKVESKALTCKDLETQFLSLVSKAEHTFKNDLLQFIEKPKRITCYDQWKTHFIDKFRKEVEHNRKKTIEMFSSYYTDSYESVSLESIDIFFANVDRRKSETNKSAADCFNEEWSKWCHSQQLVKDDETVLQDTINALKQIYPSRRHLFPEKLNESQSLGNFQPSIEKHFHQRDISQFKANQLKVKMNSIQLHVEFEFKQELQAVKQKQMPYTDRIPKEIILKVGRFLTVELKKENLSREINNKFEADLLLCLAGSIVNSFKGQSNTDFRLKQIKSQMEQKVIHRMDKIDTDIVVEIVFYVIKTVIFGNIHNIIPKCLRDGFLNSSLNNRIESKKILLGFCLKYMIEKNDDLMIKRYYLSPKQAVEMYLKKIFESVIDAELFIPCLKEHITMNTKYLLNPIYSLTGRSVSINEIMNAILSNKRLNAVTEKIMRYKYDHLLGDIIDKSMLDKCLEENSSKQVDDMIRTIRGTISSYDYRNANASACARFYCEQLIGCTESCPLCNEICIFSADHQGDHECVIHRPVWCEDYVSNKPEFATCTDHSGLLNMFTHKGERQMVRWINRVHTNWKPISYMKRESSNIWKWIYANKSHILTAISKFDIPKGLESKWRCPVNSVILSIIYQFELYSANDFKSK